MKINYVSLCSGYGAECIAMKMLKDEYPDFDFELLAWAEFDPSQKRPIDNQPAVVAHKLLHPENADRNLGDITRIDWSRWHEENGKPHIHFMMASTPCQSVSSAGKRDGMKKDSGTTSSLIWATEDAIRVLNPDMILFENVAGMVDKNNKPDFCEWCYTLCDFGYTCQYALLNAKDFTLPQNRLRIFLMAIRNDMPMAGRYVYPAPIPLEKKVEDVMIDIDDIPVDAYLNQERVTRKALTDIMTGQPKARKELESIYHEIWKEQNANPD